MSPHEKTDVRVAILADALAEADIDPQTRDCLADDLAVAERINGSTDPTQQVLKQILISGVRRGLLEDKRVATIVEKFHEERCPMIRKQQAEGETTQRDSLTVRWLGVSATGRAAVVAAVVFVAMAALAAWAQWQNGKTRELAKRAADAANRVAQEMQEVRK